MKAARIVRHFFSLGPQTLGSCGMEGYDWIYGTIWPLETELAWLKLRAELP